MSNLGLKKPYSKKVVVIGGGTGPFNLLRGLVRHNRNDYITSVAGTWDDGSSSGILRTELGIMPVGDSRKQLLALIPDPELQELWQNLFEERLGKQKHAVGNLVIATLERTNKGEGLDKTRKLMGVEANVLYATTNDLKLIYKDESGREFYGEYHLDDRGKKPDFDPTNRVSSIYLNRKPRVNPKVVEAILEADEIILSSGSLFGSVIPFLTIPAIRNAINESTANLTYILNIMTEVGQTDRFKASNHIRHLVRYLGNPGRLDYLIAHNNHLDPEILEIYKREQQEPVEVDIESCLIIAPSLHIIQENVATYIPPPDHLLRHDPDKLTMVVLNPQKYLKSAQK